MITNTFEDPLRELHRRFPRQCDGHSNLNNIMRFREKCGFPLRQMVLEKPHKRFRKDETPLEWFAPLSVLDQKSCDFGVYVVNHYGNNWFTAVPKIKLVAAKPLRALEKIQLQHGSIDRLNRTFVNENNETLECSHLNSLRIGDIIQVFDVVETKIKDDWIPTVKEYAVIERRLTSRESGASTGEPKAPNTRITQAPVAPVDVGIKDETKETTSDTVTIETRRTVKREGKIHFEEATTICFPRVLPSNVHIIKAQILPVPQ